MSSVEVTIPLRLVSEANSREHWRVVAKRKKLQRRAVWLALHCSKQLPIPAPCTVILCRWSPRQLDTDNLSSAFKAVRDEVAAWLGIDDRSPLVQWVYQQQPIKLLPQGVRVGDHVVSITITGTPS